MWATHTLKRLLEEATSEKPKRKWYSVLAEGLMDASKYVKDFTGNIAGTIGQLGKLFWPDFKLETAKGGQKRVKRHGRREEAARKRVTRIFAANGKALRESLCTTRERASS